MRIHSLHRTILTTAMTIATVYSMVTSTVADEQKDVAETAPSFRNEVMAALSKAGCNMGTCHGNANGKGGLKLSLRGQSPDEDFVTLTRQQAARRINPLNPDDSLLIRKPLMAIPHEGGKRFEPDSNIHQILSDWISTGMPADPATAPKLISLNVSPQHQTLYAPENSAQLTAVAKFSNGTKRDVTRLTVFESSALSVSVDPSGLATCDGHGLTTITARYLDQQQAVRLEFVPERPDFQFSAPKPVNEIDEVVFRQLERLKINPSPVCSDNIFIRRTYLDLTGLLPQPQDVQEFVESEDPAKRSALIDRLLGSDAFNDQQALRWADLLRVEEKTLDKTGVRVFHGWIRESFATNKPLNRMVAEIIAAKGSTYKVPPANFYRALRTSESRAESTAQLFLGIRLQCAKCHNHPFDRWTQDDYYGWSGFFGRIDYEIIENKRRDKNDKHEFNGEQVVLWKDEGEVKNPSTGQFAELRFLGNVSSTEQDSERERLERLAEWISSPQNERFAATQANRIWAQLLGTGVVDPIDDFRATNPPSNPELLDVLTRHFVDEEFNVRSLTRFIMNSKTYQLSSEPNDTNADDVVNFARITPRRLTAEQTLDAMCHVLGVSAKFGDGEAGTKAVQLMGVRNGGHRYSPPEIGDRFLALFGKPNRLQTCECERTNETTLAQTFEMVSGELVNGLIRQNDNRVSRLIGSDASTSEILDELYISALCRKPGDQEQEAAEKYINQHADRRTAIEDITWALVNSNEFLLRR